MEGKENKNKKTKETSDKVEPSKLNN